MVGLDFIILFLGFFLDFMGKVLGKGGKLSLVV